MVAGQPIALQLKSNLDGASDARDLKSHYIVRDV